MKFVIKYDDENNTLNCTHDDNIVDSVRTYYGPINLNNDSYGYILLFDFLRFLFFSFGKGKGIISVTRIGQGKHPDNQLVIVAKEPTKISTLPNGQTQLQWHH